MKKDRHWLVKTSYIALSLFSFSAVAANAFTLPFDVDQYHIPYATFVLNGTPTYAQIDTGSSQGFHLEESQLKELAGAKKGRIYQSTDAAGKNQTNQEYLLDTLTMNGLTLNNVTLTPYKPWGIMLEDDIGNIPPGPVVGLGAFNDKTVLLDYAAKSLSVYDDVSAESLISKDVKSYPFQFSPGEGLTLIAEQAGHKYRLILDTGAATSVIWQERLKSSQPVSCLLIDPNMDNQNCEATLLTVKPKDGRPVQFGAVVLPGSFKQMESIDGLLGYNFLQNRKLFIDFKNKKLFISDEVKTERKKV